jgi:hypothetical protein
MAALKDDLVAVKLLVEHVVHDGERLALGAIKRIERAAAEALIALGLAERVDAPKDAPKK